MEEALPFTFYHGFIFYSRGWIECDHSIRAACKNGDTKTLPEASLNLPIVRLADVEKNPAMVRGEPSYVSTDVDWGNRYLFDWSPLAPVQYETNEQGVVPGKCGRTEAVNIHRLFIHRFIS